MLSLQILHTSLLSLQDTYFDVNDDGEVVLQVKESTTHIERMTQH
jgi:hypothetical protein